MPFVKVTVGLVNAKKFDFRGENLVLIKPTAAEISIYRDLGKTLPILSIPAGATTLEVKHNPELSGEFFMESSVDAQSVTINYW
jgi:hypothetical protein